MELKIKVTREYSVDLSQLITNRSVDENSLVESLRSNDNDEIQDIIDQLEYNGSLKSRNSTLLPLNMENEIMSIEIENENIIANND